MNKKKRTRYLLLAVILIYVAVIVRFFMLSSDEEYAVGSLEPIASFTPAKYTVKDNFTISNDYRDSFLGTLSKKNKSTIGISSSKTTQKEEDTYFPTIKYLGIISDVSSNKKVVSLQINTKEYVTKEGSVVDSVRIISGTTKSLTISYKGKHKKITISD